jgi:hypothetical protein
VDAQQDAEQARVQDYARPWRLLLGGGQVGSEIAQLGSGSRCIGGAGSLLQFGLGQPAVGEVAPRTGSGA